MYLLFIVALFSSLSIQALEVPSPLTLGNALSLSKNQDINQRQKQVDIDLNNIKLNKYRDIYKPNVDLDLQLAKRANYNSSKNDSYAFIKISQILFDQNVDVARSRTKSTSKNLQFEQQQLKNNKTIKVVRAFFDVVLADMRYETVSEQLAISAIREGHVKDDFDIQYASEVDLLEKQVQTQLDVSRRIEAESEQISTRAKLAQLLNIAYEDRPDDLVKPNLSHILVKKLEEFEFWQKKILTADPELGNMQRILVDLKQQVVNEKNNNEILLSSSIRLGEQGYQRDKNGQWRISLNFVMPLGRSYAQERNISELLLKVEQQQLSIEGFSQELNQKALLLWLKLKTLKQLHKALIIELDYRDLYLERSRANYEMEIKSDIGNAMANLTDTEWKLTKNEFDYIVLLIQLQQLSGDEYEL